MVLAAAGAVLRGMSESTIKSARRTLEVLEFFAERRAPARVKHVSLALNYPQASTSVLLQSLVQLRYLAYDASTRTFAPTLRTSFLGAWLLEEVTGGASILQLMQELAERVEGGAVLGFQTGIHIRYVVKTVARKHWKEPHESTLRPICRVSAGRALLMAKSDAEVGLIVRRVRTEESGPARSIELSSLIHELEACRKRGYAVTHSVVVPEVTTVSSLLPNVSGQPQMALGLGTGLKRFSGGIDRVLEILGSGISELKAAMPESAEFRSHTVASIS